MVARRPATRARRRASATACWRGSPRSSQTPNFPTGAAPSSSCGPGTRSLLGIFRALPSGGARIVPSTGRSCKEWRVARPRPTAPSMANSSASRLRGRGTLRRPTARVNERLGESADQRNISLIAIHDHGIPGISRAPCWRNRGGASRLARSVATTCAIAARHHRSRRRPRSRRCRVGRARRRSDESGGCQSHGRHRRCRHLCAARHARSTARRGSGATRSISPTASCRCCPSASPTISAPCAKEERARCLAVLHGLRPQWHTSADISSARRSCARPRSSPMSRRRPRSTAGPTTRPDRCSGPCCGRSGAAYGALNGAATSASRSSSTCPNARSILDEHGRDRARRRRPHRLEAHRLIEEFMIQANVAAAEDAGGKRTPLHLSRARCSRRRKSSQPRASSSRPSASSCRRPGRCSPRISTRSSPRRGRGLPRAGQRGGAAQPGPGRLRHRAISAISD